MTTTIKKHELAEQHIAHLNILMGYLCEDLEALSKNATISPYIKERLEKASSLSCIVMDRTEELTKVYNEIMEEMT